MWEGTCNGYPHYNCGMAGLYTVHVREFPHVYWLQIDMEGKDTQLQQKDDKLQQKDTQLEQKNDQLQQKDGQIQRQGAQLQERNLQLSRQQKELQTLRVRK